MKKTPLLLLFSFCLLSLRADSLPKIVTLHPLLTELAKDLMGDQVQVVDIMPGNVNVHTFEPTPKDMVQMQDAVVVLAMGKHLESYLDRLAQNIPSEVKLYEVGRLVPSIRSNPESAVFACCPVHGLAAIDPHWWQSPLAVRRAVRHLGRELEKLFPEQKSLIRERAKAKMEELKELDDWTTETLAVVPMDQRKLVTTHNAFGYFCAQYKFQAVPVRGITNERDPSPEQLAGTMSVLKKEEIQALFPEQNASADFLRSVHEASGIPLADPLNADFILRDGQTYMSQFKQNVEHILKALGK